MEENGNELKNYGAIGSARLLDVQVIYDDNEEIYRGMIDNAPDYIKQLNYSKVDVGTPMVYYAYSKFNKR